MAAVLDVPEAVDYETHACDEADALREIPPQRRPVRAGFWRTLVQYMRRYNAHRAPRTPSSHRSVHTCEAPADLLARQYPTLYIQAYAGI
jgi:hypothetical protein